MTSMSKLTCPIWQNDLFYAYPFWVVLTKFPSQLNHDLYYVQPWISPFGKRNIDPILWQGNKLRTKRLMIYIHLYLFIT
jgi:hypothetical protein